MILLTNLLGRTGSSWNLVVANAGASVSLPGTQPPLSQNILLGYPGQLTTDGAFIAKGEDNTLGFAAQTPLFVGEGMHIIVSLPKTDLLPPDLGKRFSWFIADYGDILFALAGLAAIFGFLHYFLEIHQRRAVQTQNRHAPYRADAALSD